MKIVIITQYFLPEMGAPQSRLYELAKGLQLQGWEVNVVTAMPNYPTGKIFKGYRSAFSKTEEVSGIPTRRYWLYASNSSRTFPRIMSMISFSIAVLFSVFFVRSKKPHYLLVESPPLTLAFSGLILSRLSGAQLIMNVSDLWPLSAKELGAIGETSMYRLIEKLEHFLYRKSFLCTGQSQEIVDHIQKIKPNNVHLFRNGVDMNRFSNGSFDHSKRYYLVYAGLLGLAQGILSICKNIHFKELGAEFHIYGSGSEQVLIEQYILSHPDKGIKYMGIRPRDSMPALLSSYGGALIPLFRNIYGSVPSKIYEAMAAGLPILFSGEGEGAQIVKKYKTGNTSTPGDWDKLKENIGLFISMESNLFLQKRSANIMVANQFFDRTNQVKQLSVLLSNINDQED